MLIQALAQYYDVLAQKNVFPEEGSSRVGIHYLIALDTDGNISDIIDYQREETIHLKNGKTKTNKIPKDVVLPRRTEKSAIFSNYIEHRSEYIFGLNFDKKTGTFNTKGNTQKKFDAFVKKNLEFIEKIHTPLIDAYRAFIENWHPEDELNNFVLMENSDVKKQWKLAKFAFCLASDPTNVLDYNIPKIKQRYQELQVAEKNEQAKTAIKSQCAVSGKIEPIARIHDQLKGIPGGNATGNVLVGYKEDAFCSYGHKQAYNSNISESVMKKYTTTLNYLLDGNRNKKMLGDITLLFWAADSDTQKENMFSNMIDPDKENLDIWEEDEDENDAADAQMTTILIRDLIIDAKQLALSEKRLEIENIDPNVDFYIVGIKPNAARVAVKMIYRKRFGDMVNNIAQFQRDIQIDNKIHPIPLWRIQKELVPPKSSSDGQKAIDPALASKLLESIIIGGDMPNSLFERMINRVKTDRDLKINRIRAGIIKGYLNQKSRKKKKEEIGMSLNIQNNNQAYLCGRLFAALQKTQEDAASTNLNRTIKDAYFSSAATQPASVFPKLMMLYQNHLKQLKKGFAVNREKLIQEIIEKIDGAFPARLNLSEQGEFIIGYYQQYQDFFNKKENNEKNS